MNVPDQLGEFTVQEWLSPGNGDLFANEWHGLENCPDTVRRQILGAIIQVVGIETVPAAQIAVGGDIQDQDLEAAGCTPGLAMSLEFLGNDMQFSCQ